MSLKAYDGMMTRKGLNYLHQSIVENIPKFQEASENALAQAYADVILAYVDRGYNIKDYMLSESPAELDKLQLEKIESKNVELLSYLYQCARILSNSFYKNSFTVNLNLTIEPKNDKILVYPNLLVNEHREILLSFLDDWYCQNQTDADENVDENEWEERSKDWYDFSNVRGLQFQIKLFDPDHYWNDIVREYRGKSLIDGILAHLPSVEDRKHSILKSRFMDLHMQLLCDKHPDISPTGIYFKAVDYLNTDEGKDALNKFKEHTPIELVTIDEKFINEHIL
jgi:hypothetical protein